LTGGVFFVFVVVAKILNVFPENQEVLRTEVTK